MAGKIFPSCVNPELRPEHLGTKVNETNESKISPQEIGH